MAHQYKDHRENSPKGRVHEVYDKSGQEAAIKKGLSLDLAETTLRTWCSSWKNESPKKKKAKAPVKAAAPKAKAAKAKAKPAAKKAAPKKPAKREKLEERASA